MIIITRIIIKTNKRKSETTCHVVVYLTLSILININPGCWWYSNTNSWASVSHHSGSVLHLTGASAQPQIPPKSAAHCSSLCRRDGAWAVCFVSVFRFPHAAEHGSVRVQRQDGIPAQARRPAPQRQEVWPLLWQDWHGCGQHADHKGRFSTLL